MVEIFPERSAYMKRERARIRSGGATEYGKGDRPRAVDQKKYRANFDRIFGRCKDHPKYEAKRPPEADCAVCRRLWRERQLGLTEESE